MSLKTFLQKCVFFSAVREYRLSPGYPERVMEELRRESSREYRATWDGGKLVGLLPLQGGAFRNSFVVRAELQELPETGTLRVTCRSLKAVGPLFYLTWGIALLAFLLIALLGPEAGSQSGQAAELPLFILLIGLVPHMLWRWDAGRVFAAFDACLTPREPTQR